MYLVKPTTSHQSIPVERVVAEVGGDEPVAVLADLELEELWEVVGDCEGEGGGDLEPIV